MLRNKRILLTALLTLHAQALHAAPFCVEVQGMAAECIYDDVAGCRKRAEQLSGQCIANVAELSIQPGVGKYCLVDSSRITQCNYVDRASCNTDATRSGAVCIEAPNGGVPIDPYKQDPNINY